MVLIYLPADYDDCPEWFKNYIQYLTHTYNLDELDEEESIRICFNDIESHKGAITLDDENIIKLLTFQSEKDFNFFLLKWS